MKYIVLATDYYSGHQRREEFETKEAAEAFVTLMNWSSKIDVEIFQSSK